MGNIFNISEVVDFAVHIEQNGYKFYVETIKKFQDSKLVELFQFLGDEELKHEQIFKNLLKKVGSFTPRESYPGEYEAYMWNFLKTHALANNEALQKALKSISSIDDAIAMALNFEKDSIVLFTMLKSYIEAENQKVVETIIQEEMRHILMISRYQHGPAARGA